MNTTDDATDIVFAVTAGILFMAFTPKLLSE